ncbi:MAG TPA: hypothetical protein VGA16_09890 [Candidatus Limnocylindria bacterium]
MTERSGDAPRELLVILTTEGTARTLDLIRERHRVLQQASPRVVLIGAGPADAEHVSALPGVKAVTSGDLPSLEGLDDGEALFVRAWVARTKELPSKRRRGGGLSWDAPGSEPPDPRRRPFRRGTRSRRA